MWMRQKWIHLHVALIFLGEKLCTVSLKQGVKVYSKGSN